MSRCTDRASEFSVIITISRPWTGNDSRQTKNIISAFIGLGGGSGTDVIYCDDDMFVRTYLRRRMMTIFIFYPINSPP